MSGELPAQYHGWVRGFRDDRKHAALWRRAPDAMRRSRRERLWDRLAAGDLRMSASPNSDGSSKALGLGYAGSAFGRGVDRNRACDRSLARGGARARSADPGAPL